MDGHSSNISPSWGIRKIIKVALKLTAAWDLELRSKPYLGRPFLKEKLKRSGSYDTLKMTELLRKVEEGSCEVIWLWEDFSNAAV